MRRPAASIASATDWHDRVATEVTEQLVDRWADRLGSVAVFAHSHAVAAIDTLRFDCDLDGGASPPALDRPA